MLLSLKKKRIKNDEKERMAGVYLNRVRNGWPLEADPTVKFAVGDFTIKRVLNKHLQTDSPYNTYLYPGIPPGPDLYTLYTFHRRRFEWREA